MNKPCCVFGVAACLKGQPRQRKHRVTSTTSLGSKKQGITTGRLLAGISKARKEWQETVSSNGNRINDSVNTY